MRAKPVPALPGKPAPHAVTLTLDMMDEPPLPTKPMRRASVRQVSSAPAAPPTKAPPAKPLPTAKASVKLSPTKANAPSALPVRPAKAPAPSELAAKPASQSARRGPVAQVSAGIPAAKPTAKPKVPNAVPKAKAMLLTAKANNASKVRPPKGETVLLEREMTLEGGGRVWRMSGRHAVAYVQNSALACALLAVETRQLARRAMAVYYDKKGRAIAWQVRFDTQRWEDVMRQLG